MFTNYVIDSMFDLVIFTESWRKINDTIMTPLSYTPIDYSRANRIKGGIGVVIKHELKGKRSSSGEKISYEYLKLNFTSFT